MNILGRLIPNWVIALAGAVVGALIAFGGQQVRISALKAEHAEYVATVQADTAKAAEAALAAQQALDKEHADQAAKVAALDAKIEKDKQDAEADFQRRLRDVAAGTVRVRYVAARCPAPRGDVPQAAAPAGQPDDPGIQLDQAAGQDVLVLRRELKRDSAQIEGLKAYIRAILGEGG